MDAALKEIKKTLEETGEDAHRFHWGFTCYATHPKNPSSDTHSKGRAVHLTDGKGETPMTNCKLMVNQYRTNLDESVASYRNRKQCRICFP